MSDDPRLSGLLLRWEELRNQDQKISVAELCADCPELREAVLQRIAELATLDVQVDACRSDTGNGGVAPRDLDSRIGQSSSDFEQPIHVPGYEILGKLGHGGMGVVYKARQVGLKRIVALKVIRAGMHASTEQRLRFRREAEAVARLHHPNIVQIYDIGEHDGLPYFSLEHVEGGSLQQAAAATPQPPREAAALIEKIARALHYAHVNGIVHRDLKPANILLAGYAKKSPGSQTVAMTDDTDGSGSRSVEPGVVPKISDFGLAKGFEEDATLTQSGQIVGSPSYMAPEQASGNVKDVGPLVDVYSLGATLYDLLTGRPPFKGMSVIETLDQVRNQEPVPPTELQHSIPRDLETICLKCLAKEPHRRYPSAEALAEDLRRFLHGEPITARPTGPVERFWRWSVRYPIAAALMVSLLVGVCVSSGLAYWASIERYRADEEARRAAEATLREADEKKEAHRQLYHALLSSVREASNTAQPGWTWRALEDLAKAKALDVAEADPVMLRTLAAEALGRFDLREVSVLAEGLDAKDVAFSGDGKRLAIVERRNALECTVQIWDVASGTRRSTLSYSTLGTSFDLLFKNAGAHDGLKSVAFSPDDKWLVAGTRYGKVVRWDLSLEKPTAVVMKGHKSSVDTLAFSPDGTRLVSACGDLINQWDLSKNWTPAALFGADRGARQVGFSRDGKSLGIASGDVSIADGANPVGLRSLSRELTSRSFAFSLDGRSVVIHHGDDIQIFDLETQRLARTIRSLQPLEDKNVLNIGLSLNADGTMLAAAYDNYTVRLWDLASGRILHTLVTPDRDDPVARFSPDGKVLAVTANRRTVLYEIRASDVRSTIALEPYPIQDIALGAEPHSLLVYAKPAADILEEGRLSLWNLHTGQAQGTKRFTHTQGIEGPVKLRRIGLAAHGDTLIANGSAIVGSLVVPLAHVEQASKRLADPNPDRITVLPFDSLERIGPGVEIRDDPRARGGKAIRIPGGVPDAHVRFKVPAALKKSNWERFLILVRMRAERKNDGRAAIVHSLLFSKERAWHHEVILAPGMENQYYDFLCESPKVKTCRDEGSMYGQIRIAPKVDALESLWVEQVLLIECNANNVFRQEKLAFSPDGGRLWGVVNQDQIVSWQTSDYRVATKAQDALGEKLFGPGFVNALAAGNQWVVAGNHHGDVYLLSARKGELEKTWIGPDGQGGAIRAAALHPSEALAAIATQKGSIRLRKIPEGHTIADLRGHRQSVEAMVFSADGNFLFSASRDQTLCLWRKKDSTYELHLTLKIAAGVSSLRLGPDGQALVVLCDSERAVRVWHLDRLKDRLEKKGFGW